MKRFYLIDQNQTDARYTMNHDGICQTVTARFGTGWGHVPMVILTDGEEDESLLRRLTPLECLQLQGLPDWWCDGANGSDTAIYKMCGNGLAIPCAYDVLRRIAAELDRSEK